MAAEMRPKPVPGQAVVGVLAILAGKSGVEPKHTTAGRATSAKSSCPSSFALQFGRPSLRQGACVQADTPPHCESHRAGRQKRGQRQGRRQEKRDKLKAMGHGVQGQVGGLAGEHEGEVSTPRRRITLTMPWPRRVRLGSCSWRAQSSTSSASAWTSEARVERSTSCHGAACWGSFSSTKASSRRLAG